MELALLIGQLALKYGPAVAEEFTVLFHSDTPPTLDQWKALFAKMKPYSAYLPDVVPVSGK